MAGFIRDDKTMSLKDAEKFAKQQACKISARPGDKSELEGKKGTVRTNS